MSKKRKIFLLIFGLLVLIFLVAQVALKQVEDNLNALADLELADINLEQTEDGEYSGSFSAFPVSADVQVKLENHEIVAVDLIKHTHGQGANAEILPEIVVQAQSLNVDLVAGATYSSKVILKAIEDALMKAETK